MNFLRAVRIKGLIHSRISTRLGAVVGLATVCVAVLVAMGARSRRCECSEEFHRLVGGLGFGSALDLSDCDFSFDPRVGAGCPYEVGPIPSSRPWCCPYHAVSILYYPQPLPFPAEDPADD